MPDRRKHSDINHMSHTVEQQQPQPVVKTRAFCCEGFAFLQNYLKYESEILSGKFSNTNVWWENQGYAGA